MLHELSGSGLALTRLLGRMSVNEAAGSYEQRFSSSAAKNKVKPLNVLVEGKLHSKSHHCCDQGESVQVCRRLVHHPEIKILFY